MNRGVRALLAALLVIAVIGLALATFVARRPLSPNKLHALLDSVQSARNARPDRHDPPHGQRRPAPAAASIGPTAGPLRGTPAARRAPGPNSWPGDYVSA
jgi:hypothetical protein